MLLIIYPILYALIAIAAYMGGGLIAHMAAQEKKEAQTYSSTAIPLLALAALTLIIIKNPLTTTIILAALTITTLAITYYKKQNPYYTYPLLLGLSLAVQSQNAALISLLIILLEGIKSFNPKNTRKEKKLHYKKAAYLFTATTLLALILSMAY